MRFRPVFGVGISVAILAVAGFLIFVGSTSTVSTQPISLIPSLLGVAVGLFLCIKVPDNNIGLVVLVADLSFSLLGTHTLVQDWGVANGHPLLAMAASTSGAVAFGGVLITLLVLLPIWFPDGVAINGWSRWVARIAMIFMSAALFGAVFSGRVCVVSAGEGDDCARYVTNPWGITGFDGSFFEVFYMGLYLLAFPAMIAVVMRWRRSSGVVRAQLKWFSLAAVLFIVGFLVTVANESFIDTDLAAWASALALSGVWVSIGVAVAKYRLYDIEKVISRGLGYALVVGVLGLVYSLGAIWLPTRLIGQQHPIFVAGSTLAVAALFNPVRSRILRWADRRFYRSRYDAEEVAAGFSDLLREELDLDRLPESLKSVAVETMQPSSVGVWVRGQ
jgi:hypothetical protein